MMTQRLSPSGSWTLWLPTILLLGVMTSISRGQLPLQAVQPATDSAKSTAPTPTASPPAQKVDVSPLAGDNEIKTRLARILAVTELFDDSQVIVKDGVVFLSGRTHTEADKIWAGNLASNTEDVVAVVNRIEVLDPTIWDFEPATASLKEMERNLIRSLPFIASAVVILMLAYGAAVLMTRWMRHALERRIVAPLLREVFARLSGFLVFIVGLYVTLRIANLTHLALTIVGGTGLLGLVIGIAFGNITENFLASILLSMQHPFQVGDLVQIADIMGYIQRLTTRTTIVTTMDGNEVQIPNATVYKSVIRNYSTIPNRRVDFAIAVDRAKVDESQHAALTVLTEHPAVLKEPESTVLVDNIEKDTATLRAYFWINGQENSWLKVRSSVMRLIMHAVEGKEDVSKRNGAKTSDDGSHVQKAKQAPHSFRAHRGEQAKGGRCRDARRRQSQLRSRTDRGPGP